MSHGIPAARQGWPPGVAARLQIRRDSPAKTEAVHTLPPNRVRYRGVWEAVTSEGLGRTIGESVKGDKRTGPALNPLKGSSARAPRFKQVQTLRHS
jgi:hypothetical protein